MSARLVLGWGPVARVLFSRADSDSLYLLGEHPGVDRAIDRGIMAKRGDPTDPAVLETVPAGVQSVFIGPQQPRQAVAIARAVESVFPELPTVAYASEPTPPQRKTLTAAVDTLIDSEAVVGDAVTDHAQGPPTEPAVRLRRVLLDLAGELAIVTHANPDPDAIASARGLAELANTYGCTATVYYAGAINHQENRAMVNLLDIDLVELSLDAIDDAAGIALVDHGRPGVNDSLPRDLAVDVVVDHHPQRGPNVGRVTDRRSDVGATSTILTQYFKRLSAEPTTETATALLYGIRTDTDDFRRITATVDFEAVQWLYDRADHGVLDRIESPTISRETFETIADAIDNRTRYGSILVSNVGTLADRDAIAQAADRLLDLDGVDTTLVCGLQDETIYCSARSRGSDIDLGSVLDRAFSAVGAAGGHSDMAGAQIEAGVLLADPDGADQTTITDMVVARFLETIEMTTSKPVGHQNTA